MLVIKQAIQAHAENSGSLDSVQLGIAFAQCGQDFFNKVGIIEHISYSKDNLRAVHGLTESKMIPFLAIF